MTKYILDKYFSGDNFFGMFFLKNAKHGDAEGFCSVWFTADDHTEIIPYPFEINEKSKAEGYKIATIRGMLETELANHLKPASISGTLDRQVVFSDLKKVVQKGMIYQYEKNLQELKNK